MRFAWQHQQDLAPRYDRKIDDKDDWAQGARMRIVGRGYKAGRFTYVLSHVSKDGSSIGCILRFLEVIMAGLACPAGGLALKRRCRRMWSEGDDVLSTWPQQAFPEEAGVSAPQSPKLVQGLTLQPK
jgi:hypothetical protein